MKKYIIFPLLLLGAFFAAGCGTKNTADDNSLVVLNYGKYMDSSVLKLFEQETGIHVKLEEYESPEEMYTKYKAGSIGYDLICTSDYMVERLISEGEVNKIDFSSFSNYQNIDPSIIDAARIFDPDVFYSMPSTIPRWSQMMRCPPGISCGMNTTKIPSLCRILSVIRLSRLFAC